LQNYLNATIRLVGGQDAYNHSNPEYLKNQISTRMSKLGIAAKRHVNSGKNILRGQAEEDGGDASCSQPTARCVRFIIFFILAAFGDRSSMIQSRFFPANPEITTERYIILSACIQNNKIGTMSWLM